MTARSTALDASVLIAGLVSWHERHEPARIALERALFDEGPALLPQHALLEAYSVLTRLPAPNRLRPSAARDLLETALRKHSRVVSVRQHWRVVDQLAQLGVAGGSVYDAWILAEAQSGGAVRLLTLNARDFERLAPPDFEIVAVGGEVHGPSSDAR